MIPIVCFTPLARKMVAKYGKKELATFGSIVSIVAGLGLFIITPSNTNLDLVIYIVCQLFFSLGLGIYSTVSWAMMGDAIDYNEWKFGTREEGTVYSLHSFFRKLAQGVGPSIVLLIMGALGYDSNLGVGAQTAATANNMCWLVAALYTLSAVMMVVGIAFIYNLDKKTLETMNAELAERRSVGASAE
jgi:GPH family glycoside/pentoside/hexuronide:cation symporter